MLIYIVLDFDEKQAIKDAPKLTYKQKNAVFDELDIIFDKYLKEINEKNEKVNISGMAPIWIKEISTKLNLMAQNVQDALDKYCNVEVDSDGDIIFSDGEDDLDLTQYCYKAPKSS